MRIFTTQLLHRETVAEKTLAAVVARPPGFTFTAGQYVDATLPEAAYNDALGPIRSFSIASAPSEPDLLLLMRLRDSAFKRSLVEMPLGGPVRIEGPLDDFSLSTAGEQPLVLLAGGVGVAPFLSLAREAKARGIGLPATLLYSNRRPEDAAYLQELDTLGAEIPGFRCIPTMTGMAASTRAWAGEIERLGVPMFTRLLPSLRGPHYYLSGSTWFISGLVQELQRAGVPGKNIGVEMYAGY